MSWERLFKRTLADAEWDADDAGGRRATVSKWYHGGGAWYIAVDAIEDEDGRLSYFVRSENPDYEGQFDTRRAADRKAAELKRSTQELF